MNIPVHTAEKVDAFSNTLKDKLVMIYNFLDRESKKENPLFRFDEVSVLRAYWSLTGHWADVQFAKAFLANLESTKRLVAEQPTHTVEFTNTVIGEDGEPCAVKHTEQHKGYDLNKLVNRFSYGKSSFEIIETK